MTNVKSWNNQSPRANMQSLEIIYLYTFLNILFLPGSFSSSFLSIHPRCLRPKTRRPGQSPEPDVSWIEKRASWSFWCPTGMGIPNLIGKHEVHSNVDFYRFLDSPPVIHICIYIHIYINQSTFLKQAAGCTRSEPEYVAREYVLGIC